MQAAILSGDIIASARLADNQRSTQLSRWLREALPTKKFEISQGDTFQLQTTVAEALPTAVRIRAHLRAVPALEGYRPDARISIGLGDVLPVGRSLSKSAGVAFERSGRGLHTLKQRPAQLLLTSDEPAFDAACNTSFVLLEYLILRWTPAQAATVESALQGLSQQQIGELRGVSQPAIQQQLRAGGWPGIAALLAYYQGKRV